MEGSQRYDWLPPRRNGFSYMWAAKATTRRERAQNRETAKYHEGKGTYIDLGRKETPNVGRSYKGDSTGPASTSWRALWLTAHSAGVGR